MGPITGKVVGEGMRQGMQKMMTLGSGTELIYSLVIIVCSLMIYFGTKELYELSAHKGIKYFRQAFLYFAFAYFFRYSIKFLLMFFDRTILFGNPKQMMFLGGITPLFAFMYFSSIAIFSILYSVTYQKFDKKDKLLILFQILAIAIALASVIFKNNLAYLILNGILFLFSLLSVLILQKGKKKNKLNAIYILLLLFWIMNIVDILIPNFFQTFQLGIYLISVILFLIMLYKVLRKCGSK